MRAAHPRERETGVDWYISDADGVGGHLRDRPEDFRVRELEAFDTQPIDADAGAYPHVVCRITLRRWDTNDFADALSDLLGISRERVSWAGTKDKHAVTTQLFSVDGIDPSAMPGTDGDVGDGGPPLDGADVEVIGRAGRPVLLGDLAGNGFEVVVRDPDRPGQVAPITDDLRSFAGTDDGRVGVPNVFGPQRFGTRRPITHDVGFAIVHGDWEAAVRTYVCDRRESEREATREARGAVDARWEEGEWGRLAERLPGRLRHERSLLYGLAETGGETPADFRRALERFPTNLQRLFVNAAQSYAFNGMLSRRLARGLPFHEAVEGDVVCFAAADAPNGLELPDIDRLQRVDGDRVATVNRHCRRGRAFVTAPLVGTNTELADGEQGAIERAVLEDLEIEPAAFDLPGEFGSEGTRRAILLRTDLEVDRDPLTFSFRLPKGSYATTVLREYLKVDPMRLA